MIDHIGIAVTDLNAARAFYRAALAPLGIEIQMDLPDDMTGGDGTYLGFGCAGKPFLWISGARSGFVPVHLAFRAPTRGHVDAFHAAAILAGGRDNGAPGLRPHYHPDYYGAFVLDIDGHNIEAVCHAPVSG